MQISPTMDLDELAQRMGRDASPAEAREMRFLLCEAGHDETETVPSREWHELIGKAINNGPCE